MVFYKCFNTFLIKESCCKSIEEIDTVDDEISDHGKNTSTYSIKCIFPKMYNLTFDPLIVL